MPIRSHQLQALFARRREIEHDRIERTSAVNRYYEHWGKVTTRFENWTNPEYYKNAEEQLNKRREQTEKEQKQNERRERLRELFEKERLQYERELQFCGASRLHSRRIQATNEQLHKIEQNAKERENIKRKLDLEAKLYGRWRHGVDDDNLLFETKSTNETLAKLNWLDKKIEEQIDRERDEAQQKERELQLQQEINRTEEVQRERQLIREQEIKEISGLQEKHMEELKERQAEADKLKEEEKHLRACMSDLDKELELLEESGTLIADTTSDALSQAYNLNKIKVCIRKRSEAFCNQIKLCIGMLQRLSAYATRREYVEQLLRKYKEHLEAETLKYAQVEAMYESEAKYSMQRLEAQWQQEHLTRYHAVKQLLNDERCTFGARLSENLQRQTEIYEVRSAHLAALENSNEKLKQLVAEEQQQTPRGSDEQTEKAVTNGERYAEREAASAVADENLSVVELMPSTSAARLRSASANSLHTSQYGRRKPTLTVTPTPRATQNSTSSPSPSPSTTNLLPKVTNSFTNLNLDVWQDLPSARHGIDSPRLASQRSLCVVTPDSASRPQFARKRVAWT